MELNHHRSGSGDPYVLLHGIGSRWQMWQPVLGALTERFAVVAVDLPGFGASAMPPPGTPAGVASLASLVSDFLTSIGVVRPHVAGNSLGGLVALELARRGVARTVAGLSPAGFAARWEQTWAEASLRMMVATARLTAGWADTLMASGGFRRLALAQVHGRPGRVPVSDAADSVRALAGAPWFDATLAAIRPMAARGLAGPTDAAGALPDVPVTIAWGDRDRLLRPRQAMRAARILPWAHVVWLAGCGHVPTYDDPEQVARVLIQAATRAPSPPAGPGR